MSKRLLIQLFKNAYLEYQLATTEDAKYDALREMSSLDTLAAELYGFDFADSLKEYL